MRLKTVALALFLMAACLPAYGQIISTSASEDTSGESKVQYHFMAGFASWDFEVPPEQDFVFDVSSATGPIVAADFTFNTAGSWSYGVGGWFATTDGDVSYGDLNPTTFSGTFDFELEQYSVYGSVNWKWLGLQLGWIPTKQSFKNDVCTFGCLPDPDDSFKTDDLNAYLTGSFGKGRFSGSAGLGMYSFDGDENVESGFATGSVKIAKGWRAEASAWYIGETDFGDDSALRLTLGVGYQF